MNKADSEAFAKIAVVVWQKLVWPFIMTLIDDTRGAANPVKALTTSLKLRKIEASAVTAAIGGIGGAAGAAAIWTASLGFWGSIGYWLGIVALPLYAPIAGGLAGAIGIGGGVYALLAKLSADDRRRLATLYVHTLNVLVHADGTVTDEESGEVAKMKDRLAAIGVKPEEATALFAGAPTRVDDFSVDGSKFDKTLVEAVLGEAWFAMATAGSGGPAETGAFDRLCARLGQADKSDGLRERVSKLREEGAKTAAAVATAAAYSIPSEFWDHAGSLFDDVLAVDFSGNARRRRSEVLTYGVNLAAAAAAIGAVATSNPALLGVISKGYSTARWALIAKPDGKKVARGRSMELAARLGLDAKKTAAYLDQLDGVLDTAQRGTEDKQKTDGEGRHGRLTCCALKSSSCRAAARFPFLHCNFCNSIGCLRNLLGPPATMGSSQPLIGWHAY